MMACQQRHMSKWQQLNDRNQAQKVNFERTNQNHRKYLKTKTSSALLTAQKLDPAATEQV